VIPGNNFQTKLVVKGKATSEKTGMLFDLMHLILTDAKLDSKSRIIEILKENKARMESQVSGR
jgi:Zn-dependent M16 (insulinase) family peptidase